MVLLNGKPSTKRGKEETLQIAKELLQIFAEERNQAKGFACKIWINDIQADFRKNFLTNQLDGRIETSEVKRDMESIRPIDQVLICGDVGFGKTEVAMRAAFKAIAKW